MLQCVPGETPLQEARQTRPGGAAPWWAVAGVLRHAGFLWWSVHGWLKHTALIEAVAAGRGSLLWPFYLLHHEDLAGSAVAFACLLAVWSIPPNCIGCALHRITQQLQGVAPLPAMTSCQRAQKKKEAHLSKAGQSKKENLEWPL